MILKKKNIPIKKTVGRVASPGLKNKKEAVGNKSVEIKEINENPPSSFPIVGIGASAGGLKAFEAFFSGMPADTDSGSAFILVQHLAPDHQSILAELISRYTRMQVFEVEDGMKVKINCVYIIPPNKDMALLNGTLQLMEPAEPRGKRLPIDFFFQSLAQDQRERAIGIILSGTGSDGTLGVRAIKGEGGMVIAQNPVSTEFDGMPRSAIATGMVDYDLPPAEMPAKIIAYVAHAFGNLQQQDAIIVPKVENALKKIFVLLRAQTGHDFSLYKPSTIIRRIQRRMAVNEIDTMDVYVKYLQNVPDEITALFRDMLIGVTNFFRDPKAFTFIETQIIPRLFEGKSAGDAIRVWVTGCSTGEEAYSLAILLTECQEALKKSFQIQVFATDIDSRAIATARVGLYPAGIARNITRERLMRFFTIEPGGGAYRIHKGIRDMMVFAEHSVIKDPPFTKIDLISCRNLLIYMGSDLQKQLIPIFHYSLNQGGFLFLGTSETVGEFTGLFDVMDRNSKLYQRKESIDGAYPERHKLRGALGRVIPPAMLATTAISKMPPLVIEKTNGPKNLSPRELTEQALMRIAPAGALVNSNGNIIYLQGRTGLYLEPAQGEPGSSNILKMAREGLRDHLNMALRKAAMTKEIVRSPGLFIKTDGGQTAVNLTVHPVIKDPAASPVASQYLVVLEEAASTPGKSTAQQTDRQAGADGTEPITAADADARIAALQLELRAKEEYIQTSNEELESSTEELKSANEEMQSVNEELQSSNEELETSKEELQSVNEELLTVNTELQTKVADLSRANNDMNNLLAGTGIGTIFVDHGLTIQRFTPPVTQIMNMILSDLGRPVSHIASNLRDYDHLSADVKAVLDTLISKEIEVQTTEGKWYLMRILPYRTISNVIEGAVITFVEITELKQMHVHISELEKVQATLRESEEKFTAIANYTVDWEAWFGMDGKIIWMNPSVESISGYSAIELMAMTDIASFLIVPEDRDSFTVAIQGALNGSKGENVEFRCVRKNGTPFWLGFSWQPIFDSKGNSLGVRTSGRDITVRKNLEEELRNALNKSNELLRLAVTSRDSQDAMTVQDLDGRIIAWNPGAVKMYGWSEAEALAMNVLNRIPESKRVEAMSRMHRLSQSENIEPYRTERLAKDGRIVEIWMTATALLNETGQVYAIATMEREDTKSARK